MTRPPHGLGGRAFGDRHDRRGARGAAASGITDAVGDLMSRLPVLVWLVDAQGRVVHAQGAEPRRWGLVAEPRLRPQWDEAFEFKPESRVTVMNGIQKALRGEPVFDVVNARTSRSGGRLHLRSHFVPYEGSKSNAVMVLDTIASPTELAGDRQAQAQQGAVQVAGRSVGQPHLGVRRDLHADLRQPARRARHLRLRAARTARPPGRYPAAHRRRAAGGAERVRGAARRPADPRPGSRAHDAGWPSRHRVDQCGAAAASGTDASPAPSA